MSKLPLLATGEGILNLVPCSVEDILDVLLSTLDTTGCWLPEPCSTSMEAWATCVPDDGSEETGSAGAAADLADSDEPESPPLSDVDEEAT